MLGVVPSVEATYSSTESAEAVVHGNIKLRTKSEVPNACKTQKGKEHFGEESSVTENLLSALQKQKAYRHENPVFRLPPLPRPFCTGQRARNGSNS